MKQLSFSITEQQSNVFFNALGVLLTVIMAMYLAKLTWMVIAPEKILLPVAKKTYVAGSEQANQVAPNIAQWHLFGEASDEPAQIIDEPIAAPETRLRLTLVGVLKSEDATKSSAIISAAGKDGEYYKVGDRVQGRTTLSAVFEDRVILDTAGKLETLKFELDKGPSIQEQQVSRSPMTDLNARRPIRPARELREELRQVNSPEQFVDLAKDKMADNPEQTLSQLGLSPHPEGYQVSSSGGLVTRVGLKPGDILVSINGITLGDITSDVELIDQIYQEGSADVEIRRGGRTFRINRKFK